MAKTMTKISYAQCLAALDKYGSKLKAAEALGMSRSTYTRVLARAAEIVQTPKAESLKVEAQKPGRSFTDFRNTYDKNTIIPAKIEHALSQIGKDCWVPEIEFLKIANLSVSNLADYREQFAEFYVIVDKSGKRVWAGSKAMAVKMRSLV